VRAAMSTQRNKTDAADALGLAHIMRTGWFKAAFIKSEPCYRMRLLLSQRRNLKRKFLDLENSIRHSLKAFGIRFKNTGRGGFEAAVREAVADDKLTSQLMDAMLSARAALWKKYCRLHDLVVKFVARNELCRRFMAIPGVGPVTALSFMTSIDDPSRFRRSRDVAAYFGLTSRRWQSGSSIDVQGRISKAGDPDVRQRALRSGVGDADAVQGKGHSQDVGAHAGETGLSSQGGGRRGTQIGGDHARHVERWDHLHRRSGGKRNRCFGAGGGQKPQALGHPRMTGKRTDTMRPSAISAGGI
jgi:transposase